MKTLKRIISNLEYNYDWLRVINSPFVKLQWKFKWFKKPTMGTPYFLPRKWVESKEKPGYMEPMPIKYFGVNYWSLGWKTKWSAKDVRFEWGPGLSIVLFGTQLVIYPTPDCDNNTLDHFWEAWIVYNKLTNRSKSIEDRIMDCINLYPDKWIKYDNNKEIQINYWKYILKDKYKHLINN